MQSEFEFPAINDIAENCLAAPANSGGTLFIRAQHFLVALGRMTDGK